MVQLDRHRWTETTDERLHMVAPSEVLNVKESKGMPQLLRSLKQA